jgi:thiol-disulfide isomerase/thioredoxin
MSGRIPARTLFGILVLCLGLGAASVWLFRSKGQLPSSSNSGDYFGKLAIEKPSKLIPAPDFTLEDLSGKPISLKSLKGRVIFLNFWATWCVPCRQEMPAMERLHRDFKEKGLIILAVNFREPQEEIRPFLSELGLTFTVLLDREGRVSEEYGAWSLPLSYIINRNGEFVGKAIGSREWDGSAARKLFEDLLGQTN